jgi:molybdenum cofactor guanylyltransferase
MQKPKNFLKEQRSGFSDGTIKMKSNTQKNNSFYGLVLAGGKSSRMGMDKSFLRYHKQRQFELCFDLLSKHCEQTFISIRDEQSQRQEYQGFSTIVDEYKNVGPLSGILSAMKLFPDKAWLVLACDLPFVRSETIQHLIECRNSSKTATCYHNSENKYPEPLCAIYEPNFFSKIYDFYKAGCYCPREILKRSDIELIPLLNNLDLNNINTVLEYQQALELLEK